MVINSGGSHGIVTPSAFDKEKAGSFNRTASGRDNGNNVNIDSLANSRGESKGSKRKIFSGS